MSDQWITIIPEDPHHVPDAEARERALSAVRAIAPESESVDWVVTERIEFFDCGENFERVLCPSCSAELPQEWWSARMDEDHSATGEGFKLATYVMPCCGAGHTLHELAYEWPQGFGRFALSVMNPSSEIAAGEVAQSLGVPVRIIVRRL